MREKRKLHERLYPRHRAAHDEGVDVVRALVGVHCFQIAARWRMTPILIGHAVATVHVAGVAGNGERLAAIVALEQRDRRRRGAAFVHQPAEAQRGVQAKRDLRLHVGELFLDELVGGERAAELFAIQRVLAAPHASRTPPPPSRPTQCR